MIDLHLHTTASDGASTPEELVRELVDAGVTTFAVADHDTTAAIPALIEASRTASLTFVAGIEITAVVKERDVHVLGYFFDAAHPALIAFLIRQREDRRRRLEDMLDRLDRLGIVIDRDAIFAHAETVSGKALGRPLLAQALIAAGHAVSMNDAFSRYIGEGRPGYAPRTGAAPAEVIDLITRASGVASLAHPGKIGRDVMIPKMVDAGLQAIEVFHPDHDDIDTRRYLQLAAQLGLIPTGGSDYHGRDAGRVNGLGRVSLPAEHFEALVALARSNGAAV